MSAEQGTEVKRNAILGVPRKPEEMINLSAGDPWADAQFYGFGEGSDNVIGLKVGDLICATYHGMRISNKKGPEANRRAYAVLTTEDGTKIRLFTPGGLKKRLEDMPERTYVEITYLGKEFVEELATEVHQFGVLADKNMPN